MSIYTIYKITNKVNGKGYIGFDSNWPNRKTEHKYNALKCNIKKPLYSSMIKYGLDNFDWKVLYQSNDLDYTLNVMENKMILEHNTHINNGYGYNQTLGGEGTLGWNPSDETRQKIGIGNSGKSPSLETRQKMSNNTRGENNPNFGKKHSIETKKIISEKTKGKNHPRYGMFGRDNIRSCQYEITTPVGEILIIHGMRQFCRDNNLNQGNMIQVALGKKLHHKQYRCRKL